MSNNVSISTHTLQETYRSDLDESRSLEANPGPLEQPSAVHSAQNLEEKTELAKCLDDFDKMNLQHNLLRGIFSYGFERPSIIQQLAIVPFTKGSDIIVQAQSGTGKTATYTIGLLQQLDFSKRTIQGLILVPTRELADQVTAVVRSIGDYLDVQCHTCVGGTNVGKDISILKTQPHVVVGTPGRIFDMINRGALSANSLRTVILDEADEVLSAGFAEHIDGIFRKLPPKAQIAIVSATLPTEVHDICSRMMHEPTRIVVKPEELSLSGISQYYVDVGREDYKFEVLLDLFDDISVSQSVIFCNSTKRVDWLCSKLSEEGYPAGCIHGALTAGERSEVMKKFRMCSVRVLICSDLIARGIDVQQVSVVINFDLPKSRETYLHRIGRSGRFGRKGVSINFITERDSFAMRDIERFYKVAIQELPSNIAKILE